MKKVSADEKQARIINFIKENDFYHIKDIEKASNKMGISSMIIKDIVEQLCADNKIFSEKSGISNYFFKKNINFEEQIKITANQIQNIKNEITELKNEIIEREKNMEKIEYDKIVEINKQLVENKNLLEKKLDFITLEEYNKKSELINTVKGEINEQTDIIFEIIAYLKNKMMKTETEIYKIFEMKEDFDYVE